VDGLFSDFLKIESVSACFTKKKINKMVEMYDLIQKRKFSNTTKPIVGIFSQDCQLGMKTQTKQKAENKHKMLSFTF
jgi:hypothetical protein